MKRILPTKVREVLRLLEGTEFVVTGSLSLKLQGLLSRNTEDLDIISTDISVVTRLMNNCLDLSGTVDNPIHYRFLYEDSLFIDVFHKKNTPYIKKSIEGIFVRVSPDWCVFKTKLQHHRLDPKTIQDVEDYFKQKELLTIKYL